MQFLEMNKCVCARKIPKLKGSRQSSLRYDFLHLNNNLSANCKVYNDDMKKLV
jgi:hypothetical protein